MIPMPNPFIELTVTGYAPEGPSRIRDLRRRFVG